GGGRGGGACRGGAPVGERVQDGAGAAHDRRGARPPGRRGGGGMTAIKTPPASAERSARWIGQPLDRRDGQAKTTGAARYSADYPHDRLAHPPLVHATIPPRPITSIHTPHAPPPPRPHPPPGAPPFDRPRRAPRPPRRRRRDPPPNRPPDEEAGCAEPPPRQPQLGSHQRDLPQPRRNPLERAARGGDRGRNRRHRPPRG